MNFKFGVETAHVVIGSPLIALLASAYRMAASLWTSVDRRTYSMAESRADSCMAVVSSRFLVPSQTASNFLEREERDVLSRALGDVTTAGLLLGVGSRSAVVP